MYLMPHKVCIYLCIIQYIICIFVWKTDKENISEIMVLLIGVFREALHGKNI